MAQSPSKVYIHMIFSTKNREPAIGSECRSKLWAYLDGGLEALGCHPLKVGGVADHMHALVELGRTITIGQLIGGIKVESSKWMKRGQGVANFSWQGGYGAFSVSASQREEVAQYIGNQAAHHAKSTPGLRWRYAQGWHISAFQACVRPLLQIDGGVSTIFDGVLQLQRPWGQLPDPPWFNALARKHLVRAFSVSHLFRTHFWPSKTGRVRPGRNP